MCDDPGAPVFSDEMTMREVRILMRQYIRDGIPCPLCLQFAKVYKRTINSGMAVSLLTMWKAATTDWQHVPTTVGGKSREEGKLAYWGLVQPKLNEHREHERGWWRVTPAGVAWLAGRSTLPRYAMVYNGDVLSLKGANVSLRQALGNRFSYDELMQDVKFPDWYGQDTVFGAASEGA